MPGIKTFFLIAGLGNPGDEYRDYRHNVGVCAGEGLAKECGLIWREGPGPMLSAQGPLADRQVLLIKPQTFMNLSGQALKHAASRANLNLETDLDRILVLHDDLDLDLGRLQVRRGGGDGGHRGIRSAIAELGASDFARIRMGVGRPPEEGETVDHVLSGFSAEEMPKAEAMAQRAVEASMAWMREGLKLAMNRFNPWKKPKPKMDETSNNVGQESGDSTP